jgi:hypothetical protein
MVLTVEDEEMRPNLRLAIVLIGVLACADVVARGAEPSLEGTYTAKGLNSDGSEYHAVVRIARRGESFLVAWLVPKAANDESVVLVAKKAGVGVVSGSMLAVSYYGQDLTGVVLFQIEDGGARLVGRGVAAEGNGAVQTETLTRVPKSPAPDSESQRPSGHERTTS